MEKIENSASFKIDDSQIKQLKNAINPILNNCINLCIGQCFDFAPHKFITDKAKIIVKTSNLEIERIKTINNLKIVNSNRKANWEKYQSIIKKNIKSLKQQGSISSKKGTYLFVANTNFKISIRELFESFFSFIIMENSIHSHLVCSPKLNLYKDEVRPNDFDYTIEIQQDEIIYVGKANNIFERFQQHQSNTLDRTGAMKFGLRKTLRKNIDFYFVETSKNGELEKHIRNYYGSRFGR